MIKTLTPPPALPQGFVFHHLGYATNDLERDKSFFEFLGYRQEGPNFEDSVQGVLGCFMAGSGPRVELLSNLPGSDTLTPWIDAGIKLYHFAYLVQDIIKALEWAQSQRARVVREPVASVAFGGQEICFVMFRSGLLLEFIKSQ